MAKQGEVNSGDLILMMAVLTDRREWYNSDDLNGPPVPGFHRDHVPGHVIINQVRTFQMDIFKDFTLTWWQLGIFKFAMLSLGIIIGSTWPRLFKGWTRFLLPLFLVSAGYITYLWLKQ